MRPLVEICVESAAAAMTAEAAGADRVELCAALSEGGLTPSIGMIETMLGRLHRLGAQIMVRPRGGDFLVSPDELDAMLRDIAAVRSLSPRSGFVFGALTPDGAVDRPTMRTLIAACGAAPITFHKAFDAARDLPAALEALIELGAHRVLTSGGAPTAAEGAPALARLARQAAGRIVILAGGGVRAANVASLLAATGVSEVHLRASSFQEIAQVMRACGRAPAVR